MNVISTVELVNSVNSSIKNYVKSIKQSLEMLKIVRNCSCDELTDISYRVSKNRGSFFGSDIERIEKILKLIAKCKTQLIDLYSNVNKEIESDGGKLSKTLEKYSQALYCLNLIRFNENNEAFNAVIQSEDGCLSGSIQNIFETECYVFGTENNVDKKFTGRQGNNVFGMQNDCGIACVTQVLILAGKKVTENEVARLAISEGLCNTMERAMSENGATSAMNRGVLLEKFKVKSSIMDIDAKQLAYYVEHGHGVIASVDSGILWNRPSDIGIGHAIVIYGTAHRTDNGKLIGFVVCDTGSGNMRRLISYTDFAKMTNFSRGVNVTTEAIRYEY